MMKSNQKPKLKKRATIESHFQLLGLNYGECRTNVIRSAAKAKSVALSFRGDRNPNHVQQFADDLVRAKIAVAAYRLLDPRERSDVYERVQLCYPIDRDDAEPNASIEGKLVDQMTKIHTKARSRSPHSMKLMDQPVIEEAIEGTSVGDQNGANSGQNSVNETSSELSLEERRGIVRLMRDSEESSLRGLSPLGWIRSRLGI